jgi:4-oxalocrotonate tautomerase
VGIHESVTMPVLHLEMHPGRTLEQKRAFVQEATRVTVETLQCPPDTVEIVITEVARDAWAKGGKLRSDG